MAKVSTNISVQGLPFRVTRENPNERKKGDSTQRANIQKANA